MQEYRQLPTARWWTRLLDWVLRRNPHSEIEKLRSVEREVSAVMIPAAPVEEQPPPALPEVIELPAPSEPTLDKEPEPPKPEPEPEVETEPERVKRKYDSSFIHLRRQLANKVEVVLDVLDTIHPRHNMHPETMRSLQNLYGCDFLLWDIPLFDKLKGGDKWSPLEPEGMEDELTEVVWPIDYGLALVRGGDMEEYPEEGPNPYIELMRISTVNPKDVRGQVLRVYPKMVRIDRATVGFTGMWSATFDYVGLVGKKWVILDDTQQYNTPRKGYKEWLQIALPRMMSTAFSARYEWHVAFGGGIPNGPRLLLPTNPSDCLRLFNNRNLAPGKTRREALRHWVEQHWRDDVTTGLAFIHHHLRGNTLFSWCGFDCELFVSAYDLEQNELFKKEAKQWRAARKHNRVRVHFKKKK
jgi:hypothetical protein